MSQVSTIPYISALNVPWNILAAAAGIAVDLDTVAAELHPMIPGADEGKGIVNYFVCQYLSLTLHATAKLYDSCLSM